MPSNPLRLTSLALLLGAALQHAQLSAAADEQRAQPPLPAAAEVQPAGQAPRVESRFDILEFVVDGNSVLDTETIERAVYPFLGPDHLMKDVEDARAALEKQFQTRGFLTVSVDIPEQKVEDGVVHLRVIEGRVGRLRVTGSRYFDLGYIREHANSVAPGTVPSFPEIRNELAALNRTQDRRVAPTLRPGRDPGTVDVDLNVEDQLPLHGSAELNNRYNAFTRPLRFSGSLRYDNLWQAGHSLGLSWNVAPQHPNDSDVLSATYLMPIGSGEQSLALYGVHSSSDVVPGNFDTIGKGNIVGARLVMPLPAGTGLFHSLTVGVDHKQFGETVRLQGQDASNTPITYTPFLLQYAGFLQEARALDQFQLSANLALGQSFGNKDADFEQKRHGATASYFSLRADLSRAQNLPGHWVLFGRVNGQLSADPLISNEQISLGGADTIRGYLEAEALGDQGLMGTLELRSPHLNADWKAALPEFYALAFTDLGNLKDKQALPGQTSHYSLASRGLGLRINARLGLHLAVDYARAERTVVYTRDGDTRVEFRVAQDF